MKKTFFLFKKKFSPPLLLLVVLLAFVQLLDSLSLLNPTLAPTPLMILKSFSTDSELYFLAFCETLRSSFWGFSLAISCGLFIAFLLSFSEWLKSAFLPFAVFFQTVPIIAIAPVVVIYLGFGSPTVIFCSAMVALFPVIANSLIGFSEISQSHAQLFQLYRASRWQTFVYLRLPSGFPSIIAGMKVAAGLSVIGVVAGEFVAGGGLGAMIDVARTQQRLELVYGSLFLLAMIGVLLLSLVEILSWIFLKWRPLGYEYRK